MTETLKTKAYQGKKQTRENKKMGRVVMNGVIFFAVMSGGSYSTITYANQNVSPVKVNIVQKHNAKNQIKNPYIKSYGSSYTKDKARYTAIIGSNSKLGAVSGLNENDFVENANSQSIARSSGYEFNVKPSFKFSNDFTITKGISPKFDLTDENLTRVRSSNYEFEPKITFKF